MAEYKGKVESLAGEKDPQVWKSRLEESKDAAKKRAALDIDKTFDAAANIIDSLPVSQQDGAFNIFDIGQRFVLDTIHTLVNQITGIINNIADFLKGIRQSLVTAFNVVKDAVGTAINFIRGIFWLQASSMLRGGTGENEGVDVKLELLWLSNPMLPKTSIDYALMYLHNRFQEALDLEDPVEVGEPRMIEGRVWRATVTVHDVDVMDISNVLSTLKQVVRDEDSRRDPVPEWPDLPTPDPVSAHNYSASQSQSTVGQNCRGQYNSRASHLAALKSSARSALKTTRSTGTMRSSNGALFGDGY